MGVISWTSLRPFVEIFIYCVITDMINPFLTSPPGPLSYKERDEELKARLEMCRAQGTHYGARFIQQIYEMARQRRRS